MRFVPISCEQREEMLRVVGVDSVEALFEDVPSAVRLDRPLDIVGGWTEMELAEHMSSLARRNAPASGLVSFLGAGCYDHYVPSIVDHVLRKPEFFTAYTPYQPEVSQGTLQAIFEYQTMVCELAGLDVSNASMYDGATAAVEAALMAARVKKRDRILVSEGVHPEWRRTLETYASAGAVTLESIPVHDGRTEVGRDSDLIRRLQDSGAEPVAAVLFASPNYLGTLEDVSALVDAAHFADALAIVASSPILLGLLQPPGALGADIVVGEGQPFGNPMSFGGPGLGFFACTKSLVRHMPGRLVGKTQDADGNDGFVLTLSTREQHIRREKATSNICSNHALNALAAAVHISALGSDGLAGIARVCVERAHYMRDRLIETRRFSAPWEEPFGYEFALRFDGDVRDMQREMLDRGFLAGVRANDVQPDVPSGLRGDEAASIVLFAVTERRTRADIDAFVQEVYSL